MNATDAKHWLVQIAMACKALGVGPYNQVSLGCDGPSCDAVIAAGGITEKTVYLRETRRSVIESASIKIDGILLHAQRPSREATAEEIAAAEKTATTSEPDKYRAATLRGVAA